MREEEKRKAGAQTARADAEMGRFEDSWQGMKGYPRGVVEMLTLMVMGCFAGLKTSRWGMMAAEAPRRLERVLHPRQGQLCLAKSCCTRVTMYLPRYLSRYLGT
jgi:hypothetical protein